MGEAFGFTVHDDVVHPGDEIRFTHRATSSTDPPRRVELLLVERKLDLPLQFKANHARVVASVPCTATTADAALPVPADVPPTYRGHTIAWDYEVRVVEERLGPDAVWTGPVRVEAVPSAHRSASAGPPRPSGPTVGHLLSSKPLGRSAIAAGDAGGLTSFAVVLLVMGIGLVVGGIAGSVIPLAVFGGVVALLGTYAAWRAVQFRRHALTDVRIEIADPVVRRGEPVVVDLAPGRRQRLEVGLEAAEIRLETNGKRTIGTVHQVLERWQSAGAGAMRLATSVTDPVSYPGEHTALHWFVLVRDAALDDSARDLTTRRHRIALVH